MTSSTFQPYDYENPIRTYFSDIYMAMQPSQAVVSALFIKRNQIILNDGLFGVFSTPTEDYFYEMSSQKTTVGDIENVEIGPDVLYFAQIGLDTDYDIYERQVYSFSMVMQDLGGLFNSVYFVGLIITNFFRETLLYSELVACSFIF